MANFPRSYKAYCNRFKVMKSSGNQKKQVYRQKTHIHWSLILGVIYVLGAFLLGADSSSDITGWGSYELVGKYCAIPAFVLVLLMFYFNPKWVKSSYLSRFGISLIVSSGSLVFMGPYVSAMNAFVGEQKVIELTGTILRKNKYRGTKTLTFYCELLKREFTVKVRVGEYQHAKIGNQYSASFYQGSLGLYYQKK